LIPVIVTLMPAPWTAVAGAMVLSAGAALTVARTVVRSLTLAVADPPPETLTLFTCGDAALAPTFTVTVIAG
jgi:hypothetical protein